MFFAHFTVDKFRRFAISTYLPSSLYRSRYTLLHLPYSGSLELSLPHLLGLPVKQPSTFGNMIH